MVIFNDVKGLAARLDVSMNAACARAGIAYSTQYRWGRGISEPTQDLLNRLQAAVVVIAHERGRLPADLQGDTLRAAVELVGGDGDTSAGNPHEIVQDIKQSIRRLERSLKGGARAAAS